jgi:hypothetical protein
VRPEIEAYLASNGAKYTTRALRQQLIHAGYEAEEVDAALQETEAARAPQFAETLALRSRFWRSAFLLHAVALVLATAWILLGRTSSTYAGPAVIVLAVVLLIGLGISGLIGRGLLGRGMGVALVIPVISALLVGGSCMAMAGPVAI